MNKLSQMLSCFFSKGPYDFDSYHFKNEFNKNKNTLIHISFKTL